jgi:hypothetical protein
MRIFDKLVVAGLVAAISLAASTAPAQKGGGSGGGSTAPSTIFYRDIDQATNMWATSRMNLDGSAKTLLFRHSFPDTGLWMWENSHPSYGLRGGKRWFVHTMGVGHIDPELGWTGQPKLEFISSSGDRVQIDIGEPVQNNIGTRWGNARWLPGDNQISVQASTFTINNAPISGHAAGFYTVDVEFDPVTGFPSGISNPQIKIPLPTFTESGTDEFGTTYTSQHSIIVYYDWSPDGSRIVFTASDSAASNLRKKMWISNLSGTLSLAYNGVAYQPAWAPGTRNQIAFGAWGPRTNEHTLYVIGTNGSGLKGLATVKGSPLQTLWVDMPAWAPDGSALTYSEGGYNHSTYAQWSAVYRVNADGKSRTKLADGWPLGWR